MQGHGKAGNTEQHVADLLHLAGVVRRGHILAASITQHWLLPRSPAAYKHVPKLAAMYWEAQGGKRSLSLRLKQGAHAVLVASGSQA